MQLGLVDHAGELLFPFDNAFELFPPRYIKKVIVLGIDGTSNRIISGNDSKGSEVVSPFSHSIITLYDEPFHVRSLGVRGPS